MRISDYVAEHIMRLLDEADGTAEIQRNELAGTLGCVPSQINYVITSRFTPEHGYIVESRRGGGGYIRIIRRQMTTSDLVMHLVNSIGSEIDYGSVNAILQNLLQNQVITEGENRIMTAALTDRALSSVDKVNRNPLRAAMLKSMLLTIKC